MRFSSEGHPPDERYIDQGTEGEKRFDYSFPRAQDLTGRIVDEAGRGIAEATVHVRYHEPERPLRRSAFHGFQETDEDGFYSVGNIGIDVPFRLDVHAPGYVPVSSEQLEREFGNLTLPDLALRERGGMVTVEVVDEIGVPVGNAEVTVLADPAGYESHERGSLVHVRAFSQSAGTSPWGMARFSGVPTGRIRIRAESSRGEGRAEGRIREGQQLRINLSIIPR